MYHLPAGANFVNTVQSEPSVNPQDFKIVIQFVNPIDPQLIQGAPFNPFIFFEGDRSLEVHLSNQPPTDLADMSLFGQADDDSDPSTGKYYLSEGNAPWAIDIIQTFRYPQEQANIDEAYNFFRTWGESGGTLFTDWFGDNPGYRNNNRIFSK